MASAPEQIRRAWHRVMNATVVPAIRVSGIENVRYRTDGSGENLYWIVAYLMPRGMRDAFVFDTLRVAYKPSSTDARKGEATKKQIEEAVGTVGAVMATTGSAVAWISAALTAIGVPAATVAAVSSGLTAVLSASGPFIAVVGVIAAIVAALVGILGLATGHTLDVYTGKGIPVTDDIRRAVALRDQGGRLSDALALITPRQATPAADGLGPGVPGLYPTIFREGDPIGDQRTLEEYVAAYLRDNKKLPCLTVGCGMKVGNKVTDTLAWLGGEASSFQVDMQARRLALAQFAGLGAAESEWLSLAPSDRTQPEPIVPRTPMPILSPQHTKNSLLSVMPGAPSLDRLAGTARLSPPSSSGPPAAPTSSSSAPVIGGAVGAVAGGAAGYYLAGRNPLIAGAAGLVGAIVGYFGGNAVAK